MKRITYSTCYKVLAAAILKLEAESLKIKPDPVAYPPTMMTEFDVIEDVIPSIYPYLDPNKYEGLQIIDLGCGIGNNSALLTTAMREFLLAKRKEFKMEVKNVILIDRDLDTVTKASKILNILGVKEIHPHLYTITEELDYFFKHLTKDVMRSNLQTILIGGPLLKDLVKQRKIYSTLFKILPVDTFFIYPGHSIAVNKNNSFINVIENGVYKKIK